MASGETGIGCGALLLLVLVGLLWGLLPYILSVLLVAGLLALAIGLVSGVLNERNRGSLRRIAANAERRFLGDICLVEGGYGELTGVGVAPANPARNGLRFSLRLRLLEASDRGEAGSTAALQLRDIQMELPVPADQLEALASTGAFGRFLQGRGITMVNDLSVEARATRAALQCLKERDWAEASQTRLAEMVHSTRATLAKAAGNELLEPAIPQLQQALSSFQTEQEKLRRHHRESDRMLRKLHDFLSVPEQIRPILSFDLEGLFDPARLRDLQASFEEVVTLNDSYRALSRERIV